MNLQTDWMHKTKSQRQKSLVRLISGHDHTQAPDYISLVSAGHQGVYASMGPNFTYAIFGRDSIEVAEDLLTTHKSLVHDIIFTLARLQGVKNDNITEEEPGKIHHEYRSRVFDGELISEESLAVIHNLQRWWGGIGTDEMVYYGSFDATPLYIRLVYSYSQHYDQGILGEKYVARNGQSQTILDSLQAATDWLVTKIEQSPWKLLEYKRINPNGLLNQVWKDSSAAYLHVDGTIANGDGGIAAVELQGYAYDALLAAAHLLNNRASQATHFLALARNVQQATLVQLWMPEFQFFAQGLDRDKNGATRQIQTLTSNGALLLQSQLLKNLPDDTKRAYCEAIAKMICSSEFLTESGIRCRALRHKNIPGFVDYHGTYTVWPKETFDVANGLLQHGYAHLANQLTNRILRSVEIAGDFYELFYVEDDGKVWYDSGAALEHFSKKAPADYLPIPEPGQAWVISAVLSILSNRDKLSNHKVDTFEKQLLQTIPEIYPLKMSSS